MFADNCAVSWYALRTRSRHEKLVRDRLDCLGVEKLLPTVKRLSRWKDREKEIVVPLFPGYCFARFPWKERLVVLQLSGVVEIVGGGEHPQTVSDKEIESLKALMVSTLPYDACPYLQEGSAVEVVRGVLKGAQGILVRKGSRHRLVITVHLIQQATSVEIYAGDVRPA